MKDYKKILEGVVNIINTTEKSDIGFANICTYIGDNCPELKESEDERIRKDMIHLVQKSYEQGGYALHKYETDEMLAWLEKQGKNKDILEDATLDSNENGLIAETLRYKKEKQGENNIGISEATKQKLEDNLNKALEKETPDSFNEFLKKQGEQKPIIEMKTPEESLGIDSDTYNKIVDECIYDEQKPTDRVEPKFHVNEWVVTDKNDVVQIKAVNNGYYTIDNGMDFNMPYVDRYWHKWTIQDAKDGNVLATLYHILIFKKLLKNDGGISYCHYDFGAGNPQFIWSEDKNWHFGKEAIIHPATKEQRDTLFAKMKEAGYEWNAEKKELKKIEHDVQLTEFEHALKDMMNAYRDAIGDNDVTIEEVKERAAYMLSLINPKPAWSEEDEYNLAWIRETLMGLEVEDKEFETKCRKMAGWLKSLEDRIALRPQNR